MLGNKLLFKQTSVQGSKAAQRGSRAGRGHGLRRRERKEMAQNEPLSALASSPTSTVLDASAFTAAAAPQGVCARRAASTQQCQPAAAAEEAAAAGARRASLHSLESDLIQLCLMHLPLPSLSLCAAASKVLQQACASEVVWEHVCCRGGSFQTPPGTSPPGGWRNLHKRLRALAVTPLQWSVPCWRELDEHLLRLEEDAVIGAARQSGYECFVAEVCFERAGSEEAHRRDASKLFMTQPVALEMVKGDLFTVHLELMDEAGSDRLSLWIVRGAAESYDRQGGVFAGLAAWPLSLPPPPTYIHTSPAAPAPPPASEGVEDDGPGSRWFHVFQLRHLVECGGEIIESDGGYENSSFELGHIPSRILRMLPVGAPEAYTDDSWEELDNEGVRSCGDGLGLAMDDEALSLLERFGAVAPSHAMGRGRRFKLIILARSLFSHMSDGPEQGQSDIRGHL